MNIPFWLNFRRARRQATGLNRIERQRLFQMIRSGPFVIPEKVIAAIHAAFERS